MKSLFQGIAMETCLVLCFLCLFCQISSAGEESADVFLIQGLAFREKGEPEKAIESFKRAIEINPNFENAYLNLGISYHSLGSYDLAFKEFKNLLERNPNNVPALIFQGLSLQGLEQYQESIAYFEKAGSLDANYNQVALFNIGRAHLKLGNNKEAKEKFGQTINVDPTTETAEGAKTLLKILADKKPDRPWRLSANIGVEYDDNITVSEQDQTTNLGDFVYNFDFSGGYNLIDTKKNQLEAGYSFFQSIHDDLSAFDLQSHSFSLNGSHKFKKLNFGIYSNYSRTTLGRKDFLEIYSASPSVGLSIRDNWYARVNYSYKNSNFFNIPDRDAQTHGFGISNFLFFQDAKGMVQLGYQFDNHITAGAQFEYFGHFLNTKVKFPIPLLNLKTKVSLGYKFFFKDYKNITASIGEKRDDFRHTAKFGIYQPIYKNFHAELNYKYITSISNLAASDYQENIVNLLLGISF